MKMKKSLLSAAVAAGVAASAQAQMYLNPEGTGQTLLYPIYTVENGNVTAMHIVNTTDDAKAVKVRILEGKNSDEVLDFNLYLSPRDHFAFGTILTADGVGALVTTDNSCTAPALGGPNGGAPYDGSTTTANGVTTRIQPFVPYGLENSDQTDTSDARAWMGHVEVIEMGIFDNSTTGVALEAAVTHNAMGVPANCAAVVAEWTPPAGAWLTTPSLAMASPTGGLYGFGYVLNVEDAAAFGYDAEAIEDFYAGSTDLHSRPGSVAPDFATAGVATSAWNLIETATGPQYVENDYANNLGTSVAAVSSLFMTSSISNDVIVDPAVAAQTDWVVTFPSKKAHVNGVAALAPFNELFDADGPDTIASLSCEEISIREWSREEAFTEPGDVTFSPEPIVNTVNPELCYETQVVSWNGESALNVRAPATSPAASGANGGYRYDIDFSYDNGWAIMDFLTARTLNGDVQALEGLPVIGFAATKYVNGERSYGHSTEHKTDIVSSALTP